MKSLVGQDLNTTCLKRCVAILVESSIYTFDLFAFGCKKFLVAEIILKKIIVFISFISFDGHVQVSVNDENQQSVR